MDGTLRSGGNTSAAAKVARGTRVAPTPTNTREIPADPGPGPDVDVVWIQDSEGP